MHGDDESRLLPASPLPALPLAPPQAVTPLATPPVDAPPVAGQADEGEDGKRARAEPVRVHHAGSHRVARPLRLTRSLRVTRPPGLTSLGVEQSPQPQ